MPQLSTPYDIIRLALKQANAIGTGQTPTADDYADCFRILNDMIAKWSRKRWMVFREVDLGIVSTGQKAYSIGPGGDIDVTIRPDKIEAAYVVQYPAASGVFNPANVALTYTISPCVYIAPFDGAFNVTGGTVSSVKISPPDGSGWFAINPFEGSVGVAAGTVIQIAFTGTLTAVYSIFAASNSEESQSVAITFPYVPYPTQGTLVYEVPSNGTIVAQNLILNQILISQNGGTTYTNYPFSGENITISVEEGWYVKFLYYSYQGGPTATFTPSAPPIPQPVNIPCVLNQNEVSYPLSIITAKEDYARISLKNLTSIPEFLFYDSDVPQGMLYPWPIPLATVYAVHVVFKEPLLQFTSLGEQIQLPLEYMAALRDNLTMEILPLYPIVRSQDTLFTLKNKARDGMNVIKNANVQIGVMTMPAELYKIGVYDPYGDRVR